MRLRRERTVRNARRDQTTTQTGHRFDLVQIDGTGMLERKVQQVAQCCRRLPSQPNAVAVVQRTFVLTHRLLQEVDFLALPHVRLRAATKAIEASDRHDGIVVLKTLAVLRRGATFEPAQADTRNARDQSWEILRHQRARESDRLEVARAAIGADDGDSHLRHDFQQPRVDRAAIGFDPLDLS